MIEACFTARLGCYLELRHVKNGSLPMLAFSAAIEDGQPADHVPVTWVRVVVFGESAEQMAPRLLKGHKVYVEGKLRLIRSADEERTERHRVDGATARPDRSAPAAAGP